MSGKRGTEMNYEHDFKTLLTIGENIVIEFKLAGNGPEHDTYESIEKVGRGLRKRLHCKLHPALHCKLHCRARP